MSKLFSKTTVFIALWIILCNGLFILTGFSYTWPVFFACIFFFLMGADQQAMVKTLAGGICGFISAALLVVIAGKLSLFITAKLALFLPLALIIFSIIVFEPKAPACLNNAAFGYFTIALLDADGLVASLPIYLGALIIGGTLLILGCRFILKQTL